MKNKVTEIRNSLDGLNNSLDQLKRELVNQEIHLKNHPECRTKRNIGHKITFLRIYGRIE